MFSEEEGRRNKSLRFIFIFTEYVEKDWLFIFYIRLVSFPFPLSSQPLSHSNLNEVELLQHHIESSITARLGGERRTRVVAMQLSTFSAKCLKARRVRPSNESDNKPRCIGGQERQRQPIKSHSKRSVTLRSRLIYSLRIDLVDQFLLLLRSPEKMRSPVHTIYA